jgi:hypothetical protein
MEGEDVGRAEGQGPGAGAGHGCDRGSGGGGRVAARAAPAMRNQQPPETVEG